MEQIDKFSVSTTTSLVTQYNFPSVTMEEIFDLVKVDKKKMFFDGGIVSHGFPSDTKKPFRNSVTISFPNMNIKLSPKGIYHVTGCKDLNCADQEICKIGRMVDPTTPKIEININCVMAKATGRFRTSFKTISEIVKRVHSVFSDRPIIVANLNEKHKFCVVKIPKENFKCVTIDLHRTGSFLITGKTIEEIKEIISILSFGLLG